MSGPRPLALVVDDEAPLAALVRSYLEREGFEVETAGEGETGVRLARERRPDVIVLDLMLPGIDGLEVLTQLRRETQAYVILLTAKADETDKVVGLAVGADDYLTKPFSPRELVARVKAGLRRVRPGRSLPESTVLTFPRLRIDTGSRKVWVDDTLTELTTIEFDLLRALAEHPGRVLSREQLLERVWGYDYYGEARVVDVHIGHIRRKLGDEGFIATVRGAGYRFEGEAE